MFFQVWRCVGVEGTINCPPSRAGRLQPAQPGGNRGGGAPSASLSPTLGGTFERKQGIPLTGQLRQGSSQGRSIPALRPALLCIRGAGQDLAFSCRGR